MNLGFSKQFVPYVWDGSKMHTVREGERWRPGMTGHLWANMRRPKAFDSLIPPGCVCYNASAPDTCTALDHTFRLVQTAGQVKLFEVTIERVEKFEFWYPRVNFRSECLYAFRLEIGGESVNAVDCNTFFHRDGFRASGTPPVSQALQFWHKRLLRGPFVGQILHWDYRKRNYVTLSTDPTWPALKAALEQKEEK